MKIMLDAGHYKNYNRSSVFTKYCEGNMTWKLQEYLKAELEAYGFIVDKTRDSIEEDIKVYQRGLKAKGYDLFISLHSNASTSSYTNRVVVIKSIDNPNDILAKNLAERISEVMGITQQYQVWERKNSNGNEYYGVLRGSKDAGVKNRYIIEHSFHTNINAAKWLYEDENLKMLAKIEAETIATYYGKEKSNSSIIGNGAYNKNARVTATSLNVRGNRPNSSGELAPILDVIEKDDIVTLGYVYNSWGSIYYNGKHGFVNVKYLELIE